MHYLTKDKIDTQQHSSALLATVTSGLHIAQPDAHFSGLTLFDLINKNV